MKKFAFLIILSFLAASCAPVFVEKCYEEHQYDEKGKIIKTYRECIRQQPESIRPIKLKNKDLYE